MAGDAPDMAANDPRPDPMVPEECDLRGMPYMPLDLVTLFDSDLYALSTGDEFKAALTLWGKSFYQIPAGSLPADDKLLEHLSGAKKWRAVQAMALRGWVECRDGRMYHAKVAEKVVGAWASRLGNRARTEAARAARAARAAKRPTVETFNKADDLLKELPPVVTAVAAEAVTGAKAKAPELDLVAPEPPAKPDAEFEVWWKAFPGRTGADGKPGKTGKTACRKLWPGAVKKAGYERLMQAAAAYAKRTDPQFVVDPARWLKREKWTDEVAATGPRELPRADNF